MPPLGQLRPWGVWPAAEEARLLAHHGGRAGLQGGLTGKEPLGGQRVWGKEVGRTGAMAQAPLRPLWKRGFPPAL